MRKIFFLFIFFNLIIFPSNTFALNLPPLKEIANSNTKNLKLTEQSILFNVAQLNQSFFVKLSDLGLQEDLSFDLNKLNASLDEISTKFPKYQNASYFYENSEIKISEESIGYELDKNYLKKEIQKKINEFDFSAIQIKLQKKIPSITKDNLEKYKDQIKDKLIDIKIYFDNQSFNLQPETYLPFLRVVSTKKLYCDFLNQAIAIEIDTDVDLEQCVIKEDLEISISQEALGKYIKDTLSDKIEKQAQNMKIFYNEENQIIFEGEAQNGQKIATKEFSQMLALSVSENINNFEIPVKKEKAHIDTDERLKELGIKELVGVGYSNYSGSIGARVYNINFAIKMFNGLIIEPGEVFSFNDHIGNVEIKNGWKLAKIIQGDEIVDGVGGGVCQVSTTMFRAALTSGIEITERHGHSIQVSYYLDKKYPNHGLDATIYIGSKDLKFKNNFDKAILIQAYTTESGDVYIKFYGSSDGRKVEISKPVSYGYNSAPAVFEVSANLAPGEKELKQKSVTGFQTDFTRTISNNEEVKKEVFHTNYKSFPAKYLIGEEAQL